MAATLSPEKILKELSDLWVSEGQHGQAEDASGVLRACTMTLVVVAEQDDDPQGLGETLAALMPEHPARAIVIRLSGAGGRALAERVYQQCWMPFGQRRQICCEQVEITASDGALADLPSVVLPLAVADLPAIVWCRSARLFALPEFEALVALAHKVVIDSGAMPDAPAALARMRLWLNGGPVLGDLSWTRLTRWRNMLAQIFENRERLARLENVRRVTVDYPGERPNTCALFMGCWVRDCISRDAELAFAPGAWTGTGPASLVLRVRLEGQGIDVELRRDQDRMITTVDGLSQCTNLPVATPYLLMREELGIVRRDPVFERTLASAAHLQYPNGK
jgi:hypothetical protein